MSSYFYLELDTSEKEYDYVFRFLNKMHDENKTITEIARVSSNEIAALTDEMKRIFSNVFVRKSNEEGLSTYEKILSIIPDMQTESMSYRKNRVINQLSISPPFTDKFLWQLLSSNFAGDDFDLLMDINEYAVEINVYTEDKELYEQIMKDLKWIVPANIKLKTLFANMYTYKYLNKYYTYAEMRKFTYSELSKHSKKGK